ncbi:MAG TPA: tetratricopeptide repeat protein [bacterium]|jgi:Tfp pilus assembly protein PilF
MDTPDADHETRSERAYQAQIYFNLGYRHQMQHQLDLAIDFYQKSIETLATAEAHTYLGWAHSFAGHYDAAIRECLRAIEIDPDFGNPYNDIGSYMMAKGDLDGAEPWLKRALLAPRYQSYCFPHFNLGRVYEERGEFRRAAQEYQLALGEDEAFRPAEEALARVQTLIGG